MTTTSQIVIATHQLGKSYDQVRALDALDLKVPKNSIFGFLGPNGAGKTTTMKLLLGLVEPTSGSATIFGQDIVRDSVDIRSRIGYLPQQPRFMDEMTARETLRFAARFFFSGPANKLESRIDEMLDLVGLQAKADRSVKGFSGGERQRLGLAVAQVNYPELLILDEPAAALDPIGRQEVLRVMERLRKHATIFYSTHILDDVQQVSDSVAILNQGKLVAQGSIEKLLGGGENPTYTIKIVGENNGTLARIAELPWVSDVTETTYDEYVLCQVSVTDEAQAQTQLLRQMLKDPQITVLEFGRKRYELEQVFMQIVEGATHGL